MMKFAATCKQILAIGLRWTHYETLGIDRNASKEEVRTAFVALCKKHHPDMNPGHADAQNTFVKVNQAYNVLSNPAARQQYDQELSVVQAHFAQYSNANQAYAGSGERSTTPFGSNASTIRHTTHHYDLRDVDWEKYRRQHSRPRHGRLVAFLIGLTLVVSGVHALRIYHTHRKFSTQSSEESRRNVITYMEVRERARSSSLEEQLQRLKEQHTETLRKLPTSKRRDIPEMGGNR